MMLQQRLAFLRARRWGWETYVDSWSYMWCHRPRDVACKYALFFFTYDTSDSSSCSRFFQISIKWHRCTAPPAAGFSYYGSFKHLFLPKKLVMSSSFLLSSAVLPVSFTLLVLKHPASRCGIAAVGQSSHDALCPVVDTEESQDEGGWLSSLILPSCRKHQANGAIVQTKLPPLCHFHSKRK